MGDRVTAVHAVAAEGPAPELRYQRHLRLGTALRELVASREVIYSLAEREFRVRYKQTALGFLWAFITPVMLMLVFSLFFNRIARVETHGVPYALFTYIGLIPWSFFSTSVSQGGQSLTLNPSLLNKVFCPREVFPIAGITVASVDAAVSVGVLGVLFLVTGFAPKVSSLWVPVLLVVQLAFTTGVTLIISAIVVYLRDVRQALPLLLQIGLFATPVAYGLDLVPESLVRLYCAINPLAAVIDGYRRVVLYGLPPRWDLVGIAAATSIVVLAGGYSLFKRLETGFADVA